jgi:opacity protein-like surface antigen
MSSHCQHTMGTLKGSAREITLWRSIAIRMSIVVLIVVVAASNSNAQDDHKFTFDVGGGYSPLVGDMSSRLNNGWNIVVGGGYNFTSHFSGTVEYMYNGYGVSRRTLEEAQVPAGNSHMWSITANPKLRLMPISKLDPYLVGGVGYYRRTVEFTRPAIVPVFFFDPFFGTFYNTLVLANQVLGDITRGGIGGSAGAGFDIKIGDSGLKFFSEARYHYASTGRIPTRMVPVTFGIRW